MSSTVTANSFIDSFSQYHLTLLVIPAWRAVGAHFINCPRKLLLAHQFQIVPWTKLLQSKALPWKLLSSSALNTNASNFAFSVTVFSSQRGWEARAATGTFSKSRQTMCQKPGFLWIFICSLFILALPSTNHRSSEVSLPLQCCTSKSQDQTRRDLGRRSPLSQVPKPCSRLKLLLVSLMPVGTFTCKTQSTTVPPLPMPTGTAGLSERSTWLPFIQTIVNLETLSQQLSSLKGPGH